MVGQVQLAFLLVVAAFAHNDAAPFADKQNLLYVPFDLPFEYTVLLDDEFDEILPELRLFIIENKLDPMDTIDIFDSLLPDMPGNLKGQVDLTDGWIQDLSQVKRVGHVFAKYTTEKIVTLDMDLGFDLLDFSYQYYLKYLLFERKGELRGRLFDLKTKVLISVDLNKYHLTLNSIKFTEVRKCDVTFEGHILDSILNVATKVVTRIFKTSVLEHIEKHATEVIGAKINEWDKLIPRPNSTESNDNTNALKLDTFDIKINL